VGAVLVPGAKAPKLITRDMLKTMRLERCSWTWPSTKVVALRRVSRQHTKILPTFIDDVVHYCVANMPGAVPYTSTPRTHHATLPYCIKLRTRMEESLRGKHGVEERIECHSRQVVYKPWADAFGLPLSDVKEF